MKMKLYERIERAFEKISEFTLRLFVNSIVFALVLAVVSVWIVLVMLGDQGTIDKIRDCFIAVSFLTFFLVQRVLHKYNAAMHVKMNELVRAHENASNELISVEKRSDKEIDSLARNQHESEQKPGREAENLNTGSAGTTGEKK